MYGTPEIYLGYFDQKNYKFMLDSNSSLSFEDLYNKAAKRIKDDKNNELIEENKAIPYFFLPLTLHPIYSAIFNFLKFLFNFTFLFSQLFFTYNILKKKYSRTKGIIYF